LIGISKSHSQTFNHSRHKRFDTQVRVIPANYLVTLVTHILPRIPF